MSNSTYLKAGLPAPRPSELDQPYWSGLQAEQLWLQCCDDCGKWQWGPEWICHHCLSPRVQYQQTQAVGKIYSYERVWHPVHPALKDQGPYLVVLVELPHADGVRLVGNLLGDPEQEVKIGADVIGIYEHHHEADEPYTLLQWQLTDH